MIRLIESVEKHERFPQTDEIISIIRIYASDATLVQEISDKEGPCVLEMVGTNSAGEKVIYSYMRKGKWSGFGESSSTSICRIFFPNDSDWFGEELAEYDHNTNEWTLCGESMEHDGGDQKRWMP